MFKKIKESWNQPMTWGGYIKLALISFIAGCVYAVVYCYYWLDEFRDWCHKFMFWKKNNEEVDFEDEEL